MDNYTDKLINYIESEDYAGYDPYDALSSTLPLRKMGKYASWFLMQAQLRNPLNIRPALGIKKRRGVKSMALIMEAYLTLYKAEGKKGYLDKAKEIYAWLLDNRLEGYKGNCWAIHFPIAWTDNNRPEKDPSSVLASFVFNAIFELYKTTGESSIKDALAGIIEFVEEYVPVTENEKGICYSYTTRKRDIVYNANMLAAEIMAKYYSITGAEEYREKARKAVDFNIFYQKEDGRWNYKLNEKTGAEKEQVDFHQGFMALSLAEYMKYTGDERPEVKKSLEKSLEFYAGQQFNADGMGYYRLPALWPADIHNQAVGIITFARLSGIDKSYLELAEKILEWTNKNLYDKKGGYYYYRKYKLFTNRISYMRWSQSWMFLALASLALKKTEKRSDNGK